MHLSEHSGGLGSDGRGSRLDPAACSPQPALSRLPRGRASHSAQGCGLQLLPLVFTPSTTESHFLRSSQHFLQVRFLGGSLALLNPL